MTKNMWQEWTKKDAITKLQGWARDGLTDEQLAEKIGITRRTLARWKVDHEEIGEALRKGKEIVDRKVEESLYKRALGYEYEETETIVEAMADGSKKQRIKKLKRHMPADTTAMIFWLKNRKPNEWRDRYEQNLSGSLGTVKIVDDIPREDKKND